MKLSRTRAVLAALGALTIAACMSDLPPTASKPVQRAAQHANGDLLGSSVPLLSLYGCSTTGFGSVTQNIGPLGGTIAVGPHTLVVPPGALSSTVAITATAPAGDHVEVDFKPTGLRFSQAATLTLSYRYCNVLPQPLLKIVYVDDYSTILELLPSLGDLLNETVTASIGHFSGYALAE